MSEKEKTEPKKSEIKFDNIKIVKDPANFITTIILDRPPHGTDPRVNTISLGLLDDLDKALDLLYDDEDTRVIIIKGANNCFSGGADIFGGLGELTTAWQVKKMVIKGQRVFKRFRDIPKPVIALIEQYAIGGGLELAMNCDLRFATKSAMLSNPEVRFGLIPGWGGTQLMARHIGVGRTMEIVLIGEYLTAKRAYEIGLVNKIFDKDIIEKKVYRIAKDIAMNCSPIAVGVTKQMVNFAGQVPLDIGLEMESYGSGMIFTTEDLSEGINATMRGKTPKYKNK